MKAADDVRRRLRARRSRGEVAPEGSRDYVTVCAVDGSGQPPRLGELKLHLCDDETSYASIASTDGFGFARLQPGIYRIRLSGPDAQRFRTPAVLAIAEHQPIVRLALEEVPTQRIRVRMGVEQNGQLSPFHGAVGVYGIDDGSGGAWDLVQQVRPDANGLAAVTVVPGQAYIVAPAAEVRERMRATWDLALAPIILQDGATVLLASRRFNVVFSIDPARVSTNAVLVARPIDRPGDLYTAIFGFKGNALLELRPGQYEFYVSGVDDGRAGATALVTVPVSGAVQVVGAPPAPARDGLPPAGDVLLRLPTALAGRLRVFTLVREPGDGRLRSFVVLPGEERFALTGITPGEYRLSLDGSGVEAFERRVTVCARSITEVQFNPEPLQTRVLLLRGVSGVERVMFRSGRRLPFPLPFGATQAGVEVRMPASASGRINLRRGTETLVTPRIGIETIAVEPYVADVSLELRPGSAAYVLVYPDGWIHGVDRDRVTVRSGEARVLVREHGLVYDLGTCCIDAFVRLPCGSRPMLLTRTDLDAIFVA